MVKERGLDPRRLDVRAFAGAGGSLGGEWPQSGFTRLADSLMPTPGDSLPPPATWTASGERRRPAGAVPETWLRLQTRCAVTLQCQRCLQPMVEDVVIDRRLRFVDDEDDAARLDEESEDDVLVASRSLDLHALLEDELILALPLVPRHDVCPQPLPMGADGGEAADEAQPNPFAALAALRRPPPPR